MKNGLHIEGDGTKKWYLNGELHREDGPAVEWVDGSKWWYLNGKCHRKGGPAAERPCGTKWWNLNGKLHREDGPAIEYANAGKEWYLNNEYLGEGAAGFWALWDKLPLEKRNNLNLHFWMAKYST